jgi:exonuclease SbcC
MVPVSLKLKNFLSYGNMSEALDFSTFQVACLSGGNGQGKSALLEAMTWALWGEARKGAGGGKPDDQLVRLGDKFMEVEFCFDLESERYMVKRRYDRTKKTPKPNLWFGIFDESAGEYRNLTDPSIPETQKKITRSLGIDYDTFINTSFLLQGRSDEFTKRKPTERKEVLSKILQLDKYERLKEKAQEQVRQAKSTLEWAEREKARLQSGLLDLDAWKADLQLLQNEIQAQDSSRAEVVAAEAQLAEQFSRLEAQAQALKAEQARLSDVMRQIEQANSHASRYQAQLVEAASLIAQADVINRDYEQWQALQQEREVWDDKSIQARTFQEQASRLEQERIRQIEKAEAQIARLKDQNGRDKHDLSEGETKLLTLPRIQRDLEKAQEAVQRFESLQNVQRQRKSLEQKQQKISLQIQEEKSKLQATIEGIKKQIVQAEAKLQPLEGLRTQSKEMETQRQQWMKWEEEKSGIEEAGKVLRAQIDGIEARYSEFSAELLAIAEKNQRVLDAQEDACPTCGTQLTESHKSHVLRFYQEQKQKIEVTWQELRTEVEAKKKERESLKNKYLALKNQLATVAGIEQKLLQVQEQIRQTEESQKDILRLKSEVERYQIIQERGDHILTLRQEAEKVASELAALQWDEAEFGEISQKAGQVALLANQVRDLEMLKGKCETLQNRLKSTELEEKTARDMLASGALTATLDKQIVDAKAKVAKIGYDGARHEQVRVSMRHLSEAQTQFNKLMSAYQNRDQWNSALKEIGEEQQRLHKMHEVAQAQIEALGAGLQMRSQLEEQAEILKSKRAEIEQELNRLHNEQGKLSQKLAQADADLKEIARIDEENKVAIRQRDVYQHLVKAFSQDGIPALIIRQNLPELQERANELLQQLTEGRMSIYLTTEKDKRDGGTKSTLDIIICDEFAQLRPYETFSGGEAFRVNFALRIAISELLAVRSGVRIQTLVIDEGFGTQDREGIDLIKQAIQTILPKFEKIIIITHLDELKNAFPTRIEVTKDAAGSRYEVILEG